LVVGVIVLTATFVAGGVFYGSDLLEKYGPHNDQVVTENRTANEITSNLAYHLTRKTCEHLTAEAKRVGTLKSSTCQ
jgi:hypothetical protein